jgi:hypothetical protein
MYEIRVPILPWTILNLAMFTTHCHAPRFRIEARIKILVEIVVSRLVDMGSPHVVQVCIVINSQTGYGSLRYSFFVGKVSR